MLPDPTSLLNEVDSIDEMVLLIAPGDRDQPDLLRRIAALRTRVAYLRKHIYAKEKVLQDCISPPMRACFVSGYDEQVMTLYKETLSKVAVIVSRLDDTRDTLNQANLNFITASSMRMTQISADMDLKMKIFGQVATICMPLHLATAVYGMNVPVPFMKGDEYNLTAFWITLACMFVWMVAISIPTFLDIYRSRQSKSLIPEEL